MRQRRAALLALACALSLSACDEGPRADPPSVYIVDAEGNNPLMGRGTITIVVDQGTLEDRRTFVREYEGGSFEPFSELVSNLGARTRISVEARSDDEPARVQIGSIPRYIPLYGFASVVLGEPRTCAELSQPLLPQERSDLALVAQGATMWVIGGTDRSQSTDIPLGISSAQLAVWEGAIVDATTITEFPVDRFSSGLHETQAVLLPPPADGQQSIIVLSRNRAFRWNANDGETSVDVHTGAGRGSLVDLGSDGAAIVGGGDLTGRADRITWVDALGMTTQTRLATPRRDPAAIFVGGALLVAGGQEDGQPLFEIASLRGDGTAVDLSPTDARELPILVRDPQHRTAALLGGRDASGELVHQVLLVNGCPGACAIEALPAANDWADPRVGAAVTETARGTWILGGLSPCAAPATECPSAGADRVTVTNVAISIDARSLDTPRAHAAAAHLGQGIVVLAGGVGADLDIDHLTMCWPAELEPLE